MKNVRLFGLMVSLVACVLISGVAAAISHSNTHLTNQTQTMFVRAEGGWTTYDSELVDSNASAPSMTYTVGGFAGENRVLGISMSSATYDIPFELNDSDVQQVQNSIKMQARIGLFQPSVVYSQTRLKTHPSEDTAAVDVFGNAAGVGLAFHYPLMTSIIVHAEGSVLKTSNVTSQTNNEVDMGLRQEGEVGASVDLTDRLFDITVGYRYKNFSVTVDDKEYKEIMSTPYAGLQIGTRF